jgi:opacity protein-like surface antigen
MFTRNWSAKIEGLYIWNTSNSVVDAAGPKGYRTKADHFVVRAGINYRFGGSAAPVVARY